MQENWKPVVGFEGTHEVSDQGRVRSVLRAGRRSGMMLKPWTDAKGYVFVTMLCRTKKMHRVVLEAFVGPCPEGHEGAHCDGRPSNNRLNNLAWKTPTENCADRLLHGRHVWGEKFRDAKLTDEDVTNIRKARKGGEQWKDIHARWPFVAKSSLISAGIGTTFKHLSELPALAPHSQGAQRRKA